MSKKVKQVKNRGKKQNFIKTTIPAIIALLLTLASICTMLPVM